jgi:serine/threonine protein kinase
MTEFEQFKERIERYVRSGMTEQKRAELMSEAQKIGISGGEFVMLVKNAELELKFQTGVSNTEYPSETGSGFLTAENEDGDENASGFITEETTLESGSNQFTEIKKLASSGAMSDIYSAVHLGRRKVIIKRIKEGFRNNSEYKNLFYKEFDTGYALDNPNIVHFYGKGEDENGPYYYMEYVDGRTLADYLKEGHALNTAQITRIILQILDALKYMHGKQVFHRDLKPANIMLTFKGDNVKIIDFGLAADDTIVDNLQKAGTPKYSAPEVLNNAKAADQRSDIYSLGMIILEIFTGNTDRQYLSQINSQIFKQIADKATMRFPNDRYHSCDEIIALLKTESNGTGTSSPVPKWLEEKIKDYASDGFISRNERIILDQEIAKTGADKKIVEAMINDEIEKAILKKRKDEDERRRRLAITPKNAAEDKNSMRGLFKILLWVTAGLLLVFGIVKWYKNGFRMPDFSSAAQSVLQEEFQKGDKVYVTAETELLEQIGGKVVMKCAKNQEFEVVHAGYYYIEVKNNGKRGYIHKEYLSHYKQ